MQKRRAEKRGFTLIEVMMALFIFLMMTLMLAAVIPIAARSAHFGNRYTQAMTLTQHKADQLRAVRGHNSGTLNYASLTSSPGMTVIDSAPLPNGDYTFTDVDKMASFFPPGCSGTISIAPYDAAKFAAAPGPGQCMLQDVTITVTWTDAGHPTSFYVTKIRI